MLDAIAIRLEALAIRLEATAVGLEAIAFRLEAIAIGLEERCALWRFRRARSCLSWVTSSSPGRLALGRLQWHVLWPGVSLNCGFCYLFGFS